MSNLQEYLDAVEFCDREIGKQRNLRYQSYADYEKELQRTKEAERAALIRQHGPPKTEDGVEITIGLQVFMINFIDENDYAAVEDRVENFDFIFNHWTIKVERRGLAPFSSLYSTRLAATGRVIQLYREQIQQIEAKITKLARPDDEGIVSGDDHPDSAEN